MAETIGIVESNRAKFSMSDEELAARKNFVNSAKAEIEEIKKGFQDPAARALMKKMNKSGLFSGREDPQSRLDREIEMDNGNFIQQQLTETRALEEEQDDHIKSILRSVNTIEQVFFSFFFFFFFFFFYSFILLFFDSFILLFFYFYSFILLFCYSVILLFSDSLIL